MKKSKRNRSSQGAVTVLQVAAMAGVSPATVSRVLNRPDTVREKHRSKVLNAISKLNYVPHGAARALASKRTKTIGAVVPTLDNGVFAQCIEALQTRINQSGYVLLLATGEYDLARESEEVRALLERGIDGLMLVGADHDLSVYARLQAKGIPLVLTWALESPFGHGCVGFDNTEAARQLANHLLDLGHRRFGIIAGITRHNDRAAGRLAGYKDALAKRGIDLNEVPIFERNYTVGDGRAAMRMLMDVKPRPTAVLCGNDILAIGALAECSASGLNVPKDVSIAGFDDNEMAACVTPPLTTVRVKPRLIGEYAAQYLIARLSGARAAKSIDVQAELILRQSTAAPKPAGS